MIELYGMLSPTVRKIGLILEELELSYTLRHVAVFRGQQFEPDFLRLNPLGKVPVLIDHDVGETVFESGAILIYLAEKHGRFLPAAGSERYEVLQWLMMQASSVGPMFGQHNHFQFLGPEHHPYAAARYSSQAKQLYRVLDDRLTGRDWLAGGAYSIADMGVYPWALYLEPHGFDAADHPALIAWRNRIAARPATARSWTRLDQAFEAPQRETRRAADKRDLDRFFVRDASVPDTDYSAITRL